jgi:DNA-binding PadR family transcriptional regulator
MEGQFVSPGAPATPSYRLNGTAASLLGFLHEGPMTGWDLAATAQRAIGNFWSLTPSQVYRELAAMAQAGLIRPGKRGPRDRQPYTLTRAGRAAFKGWINLGPGPENIRFPLLLTIEFGRHLPPDTLATFVHHHRSAHARKLADYEHLQQAALDSGHHEPYAMATLHFGIAHERAALEWFEQLPPEIRGSGPWTDLTPTRSDETPQGD